MYAYLLKCVKTVPNFMLKKLQLNASHAYMRD